MTTFQELTLTALVLIVLAVCLCAHYLQAIIKRMDGEKGGAKVATAAKVGGGYARR